MIKKIGIRFILIAVAIYAIVVFVSQQKLLNTYASEKDQYQNQINSAKQEQNKLNETLDNLNSTEYIEDIARNKLDMYLPNEKVYIDVNK
jgi:cell division protein FtsL